MPIVDAIEAEIERVSRLETNSAGRIADTYDTLQGMAFLRGLHAAYLRPDGRTDTALALALCSDLITYNLIKLFARSRRALGEVAPAQASGAVVGDLAWISSLLMLSRRVHDTLAATAAPATTEQSHPLLDQLASEHVAFCDALWPMMEGTARGAIARGYLGDAAAVTAHTMKLISARIRQHLYARKLFHDGFDADYFRYVASLVDSVSTSTPTYLDQFRLLHQAPECLSFAIDETVGEALAALRASNVEVSASALRRASGLLDLVLECLTPLVELMYPSEYFKFRANLGATSGSQSVLLSDRILRSVYREFGAEYLRRPKAEQDALSEAVYGFRHRIAAWRAHHIALPRNVLGVNTTSAMGARNAPDVVRNMADSFERADPLASAFPVNVRAPEQPPLQPVETGLLAITGEETRARFADIEQRSHRAEG